MLQGSEQRAAAWRGKGNSENLLELLSSFFALYSNAVAVWSDSRSDRYTFTTGGPVTCICQTDVNRYHTASGSPRQQSGSPNAAVEAWGDGISQTPQQT